MNYEIVKHIKGTTYLYFSCALLYKKSDKIIKWINVITIICTTRIVALWKDKWKVLLKSCAHLFLSVIINYSAPPNKESVGRETTTNKNEK